MKLQHGHVWDWDAAIVPGNCVRCDCTREEYEDGLQPMCHPTANAMVLGMRATRRGWNTAVRRLAKALTI